MKKNLAEKQNKAEIREITARKLKLEKIKKRHSSEGSLGVWRNTDSSYEQE